ncbi:MAG: hypothetical protein Q8933_19730 [Bacteroidota bacterium]|nr:hypothetical protein [Bacteroidota bacterium]MDP4194395.1 hypothetical protein [Bacteroidota bacterium]
MADINIQPKKTSPWSYVLYGVAFLALAFLVIRSLSRNNTPVQTPTVTVDTAQVSGSVKAFVNFIHSNNNQNETGSTDAESTQDSPQFASYGMHLLAAAIGATVDRDDPYDQQLKQKRIQLQQLADSIKNNWDANANSEKLRSAFIEASDILSQVQIKHYPELQDDVMQIQKAAEAINPDQKAIDQNDLVRDFFEQSGQVLQSMIPKKQNAGIL